MVLDRVADASAQTMLMPIMEDRNATRAGDSLIKTISTRIAGGRKEVSNEQSRVSILHH